MEGLPRIAAAVPAKLRRERIRVIVCEGEYTLVADLAELPGTSEVTVRSDLDALKRRMLRAARCRVVAVDGAKIGGVALAGPCGLDEVDQLVTGASADAEALRVIAEAGVEARVA